MFFQLNKMPKTLLNKLIIFSKSLFWHINRGMPKSTQTEIDRRYKICSSCDAFDKQNKECMMCGCNINRNKQFLNKLAWADQKCPLNKW